MEEHPERICMFCDTYYVAFVIHQSFICNIKQKRRLGSILIRVQESATNAGISSSLVYQCIDNLLQTSGQTS